MHVNSFSKVKRPEGKEGILLPLHLLENRRKDKVGYVLIDYEDITIDTLLVLLPVLPFVSEILVVTPLYGSNNTDV